MYSAFCFAHQAAFAARELGHLVASCAFAAWIQWIHHVNKLNEAAQQGWLYMIVRSTGSGRKPRPTHYAVLDKVQRHPLVECSTSLHGAITCTGHSQVLQSITKLVVWNGTHVEQMGRQGAPPWSPKPEHPKIISCCESRLWPENNIIKMHNTIFKKNTSCNITCVHIYI